MNSEKIMRKTRTRAPALAIFALAAMPSFAAELVAVPGQWTPPGGGISINMWGYVEVTDAASFEVLPSGSIRAITPPGTGTVAVEVTNASGASATSFER